MKLDYSQKKCNDAEKDNSSYNPISTVAAMIRSIVFSPYRKEV